MHIVHATFPFSNCSIPYVDHHRAPQGYQGITTFESRAKKDNVTPSCKQRKLGLAFLSFSTI